MSDALDRQASASAVAGQSSIAQRNEASTAAPPDPSVGRARELRDAGYRDMPDPSSVGADKPFGSDYSGLSNAAEALAHSRQPAASMVTREYLDGEGAQADGREAVTLRRAADDLSQARADEAAAIESARVQEIAGEDDELPASGDAALDEADAETSERPVEQGALAEVPDEGDLDPIVQEALKHPQVRQAIEEQIGRADLARQSYDEALHAVGGILRDVVFAQFPELRSDNAQQFEVALTQLSQRDPARYGEARALADRLSAVQTAQLHQEQQRDAEQRREFADYAKLEDARFDRLVKGEKPETVQKVSNEIIAYAAELGVPRGQFLELCATEPIMRNAAFQKMMYDAASYRLLQRARSEVVRKVVPPVQRPGVAADVRAALSEGDMRALNTKFANDPTIRNAADVLAAQRRAKR